MSTIKVTNIQDTSGGNQSTSEEIFEGRAKVWVNFNGTGTIEIRDDFNVESLTDNGTGDYTITFTNALANTNYAVSLAVSNDETGGSTSRRIASPRTKATGSQRISSNKVGNSDATDCVQVNMIIFGD
jgi:hypothetical protein